MVQNILLYMMVSGCTLHKVNSTEIVATFDRSRCVWHKLGMTSDLGIKSSSFSNNLLKNNFEKFNAKFARYRCKQKSAVKDSLGFCTECRHFEIVENKLNKKYKI